MTEHSREISNQNNVQLAVGMRVRVYPGTDAEGRASWLMIATKSVWGCGECSRRPFPAECVGAITGSARTRGIQHVSEGTDRAPTRAGAECPGRSRSRRAAAPGRV